MSEDTNIMKSSSSYGEISTIAYHHRIIKNPSLEDEKAKTLKLQAELDEANSTLDRNLFFYSKCISTRNEH